MPCLRNYIDYDGKPRSGMTSDADEMREMIANLQKVGLKHGIMAGELLMMINKTYGWTWGTIPAEKFLELEEFIINNKGNKLKIVDPSMAQALAEFNHENYEPVHTVKSMTDNLDMERPGTRQD